MRERPILFSAPMVRAILAGTKCQTRRVVKPRKDPDYGCELSPGEIAGDEHIARLCPYGAPGDRLWVRETHMDLGGCYLYRADDRAEAERAAVAPGQGWRPSIHMPRTLSRITLEITAVRVERLQDISEADVMAEGVRRYEAGSLGMQWDNGIKSITTRGNPAQASYRWLWESINGAGSWDANPWVWVVAFKRVAVPEAK